MMNLMPGKLYQLVMSSLGQQEYGLGPLPLHTVPITITNFLDENISDEININDYVVYLAIQQTSKTLNVQVLTHKGTIGWIAMWEPPSDEQTDRPDGYYGLDGYYQFKLIS